MAVRATVVVGVTGVLIKVLLVDIRDGKIILLEGFVVKGLKPNSCIGCMAAMVFSMKVLIRTAIHSILLDVDI